MRHYTRLSVCHKTSINTSFNRSQDSEREERDNKQRTKGVLESNEASCQERGHFKPRSRKSCGLIWRQLSKWDGAADIIRAHTMVRSVTPPFCLIMNLKWHGHISSNVTALLHLFCVRFWGETVPPVIRAPHDKNEGGILSASRNHLSNSILMWHHILTAPMERGRYLLESEVSDFPLQNVYCCTTKQNYVLSNYPLKRNFQENVKK